MAKKIIREYHPDEVLEEECKVKQNSSSDILKQNPDLDLNNDEKPILGSIELSNKPKKTSKSNEPEKSTQKSMSKIKYNKLMSFIPPSSDYYLYSLTFLSDSKHNFIEEHIGVICKCIVNIDYSFPLYERENKYKANWKFVKKLELDKKEKDLLMKYTDLLFGKLNDVKYKNSSEKPEKFKNEKYLICILKEDSIDMEEIVKTLSTRSCIYYTVFIILTYR